MLLFKCKTCGCTFTIKEETLMGQHKNYWCQNCTTTADFTGIESFCEKYRISTNVLVRELGFPGAELGGSLTLCGLQTTLNSANLTMLQYDEDLEG